MARKFRYFNNSDKPTRECAYNFLKDNFVIQYRGREIKYIIYDSVEEFYEDYLRIDEYRRSHNEVVVEGLQKFRLDIDGKITPNEMDCLIYIIRRIFRRIGPYPEILVYDIKTSHHIVVSNIALESSGCCHMLANLIMARVFEKIPRILSLIDLDIYKRVQMFRIEGSAKYMQQRWKYLEGMKQISSLENFKKGLVAYTKGCHRIDTDIIVDFALESGVYEPYEKLYVNRSTGNSFGQELHGDKAFAVRKTMENGLVVLNRLKPSYCVNCKRIHEKENAYIAHGRLYCRRNF